MLEEPLACSEISEVEMLAPGVANVSKLLVVSLFDGYMVD